MDARSVIVYKAPGCKLGTFDSSESLSRLELKFLHGTMEKGMDSADRSQLSLLDLLAE